MNGNARKLRSRIITACCLASVVLTCIYLLPPPLTAAAFALAAILAAWEWVRFTGFTDPWRRGLYVCAFALALALAYVVPALRNWVLWLGAAVWVGIIIGILAYPAGAGLWSRTLVSGSLGVILIWSAWCGILVIHDQAQGDHWLVWLFLLVSSVDVGAYFTGKKWGRTPLAPSLSPAKTWEGLAGGVLTSILICGGALALAGRMTWTWAGLILVLVAAAVFGDLLESLIKRRSGVKDSGTLLPGHGGLLDRIDSALPTLPIFALALMRL